jgi:ABC-type amino acid transport substrate-binding protein
MSVVLPVGGGAKNNLVGRTGAQRGSVASKGNINRDGTGRQGTTMKLNRTFGGGARAVCVVVATSALVLAGCGSDKSGESDSSVSIAVTSGADPGDIVAVTAPVEFGSEFDLTGSPSDIKRFDSHATAAQVVLSGRADVLAGSFASSLALIEKRPQVRIYCPMQAATAEMLVGLDDVKSLADLKKKSASIAIDSPGGAADSFLNTLLQVKDAGFTVADIPNKLILEDGGQRLTAVQTGEAKATVMDNAELAVLESAIDPKRIHVISVLAEDIGATAIYQAFAADSKWLNANKDLAARHCASIVFAARSLGTDVDELEKVANKYIEPDPRREDLEQLVDLNTKFTVWPTEAVISMEQFEANMKSALASGVLDEELAYEDVIDLDVMQAAAKLLDKKGAE